jgi:dipeptide/tripeptide permease
MNEKKKMKKKTMNKKEFFIFWVGYITGGLTLGIMQPVLSKEIAFWKQLIISAGVGLVFGVIAVLLLRFINKREQKKNEKAEE